MRTAKGSEVRLCGLRTLSDVSWRGTSESEWVRMLANTMELSEPTAAEQGSAKRAVIALTDEADAIRATSGAAADFFDELAVQVVARYMPNAAMGAV